MAENRPSLPPVAEPAAEITRGGYSGALDATDLPPPADIPSGTVTPQPAEPACPPGQAPGPPAHPPTT